MNITIRQFAEIAGVTAVVLSLLFVAYKLRLARSIAESEGFIQAAEINRSLNEYISNNSELWSRGCKGEELTPSEDIEFTNITIAVLGYQFTNWSRSNIGISNREVSSSLRRVARNRYNFPGINAVWEKRPTGSPEFIEAVEQEYKLLIETDIERILDVSLCGL